jgi:hypothetical protein
VPTRRSLTGAQQMEELHRRLELFPTRHSTSSWKTCEANRAVRRRRSRRPTKTVAAGRARRMNRGFSEEDERPPTYSCESAAAAFMVMR